MYNLMIIEKNPYKLDKIVNSICEKYQNIRICYIFYDDKEILHVLQNSKIDLILIDCKLNQISEINFIDYIQKKNLYQYKKSIIINLDKITNLKKYNNDYIFSYTNKINILQKDVENWIKYKNNIYDLEEIRTKIKQELIKLKYNYVYVGTKYLEQVILEIYKVKFDFDGNLSKEIYPIIAKRHNKKIDTIYGNIKQATNFMIEEWNKEQLRERFDYIYYIKPKVQDIVFKIVNKL